MSVQTQIERLTANVAAALEAIAAKGVTVPAGANSDNLAELIMLIISAPETATITVNGAPGETISYSGAATGSVKLDSTGTGTISDLDLGDYSFTGSVSGYTKDVTISKNGTVNVYPDGAIYWYGRFVKGESFTGIAIRSANETYAKSGNNTPTITIGTNSVTIKSGTGNLRTSTAYLQSIALKAGTVTVKYTSTRIITGRMMVFNSLTNGHANTAYVGVDTNGTKTTASMMLSSDTGEYVGVELGNNASGTQSDITIYEIVNNY